MADNDPISLYNQYYLDRKFERLDLFQLLADQFGVQSAMYPGSFVHVTPSFVYPLTVYVDTDARANTFFNHPKTYTFITERKLYAQEAAVTFYSASYTEDFGEQDNRFDLLISQYAGFISQHCKRYLKIGGYLVANNSHGDVTMVTMDGDYELRAVVLQRSGKHRLVDTGLEPYLTPKSDKPVRKADLEKNMRGISYKKAAAGYIFKRIK